MIDLKGTKVALISLGCDKNLMDSEVMLGLINEEGCLPTNNAAEAGVIIVNTCGFILDASQESVNSIIDAAEYKKTGVCKAVVVTGCLAQRYKDDIFDEMPEVDAVVGVTEYAKIVGIIKSALSGEKQAYISDASGEVSENALMKRIVSTPKHYAYMKIAEGCDNCCTYCTIPSIRGKYRSRKTESLIKEAELLAEKGVKELILVAQDTSLYGKDLYGKPVLHELLRKLSEIEGIEWLRILYCYPEHITDELINEMAANKKVLHYIDMPIQHSSDAVLKLMGRRSTAKQLTKIVEKLRTAMPDIAIRTTIITGFPGETEKDFDELISFLKKNRFDRLGVFAYSKEEGTPAYKLKGHIPNKIKQKRKDKIMELQNKISAEKCAQYLGREILVLVDGSLDEQNMFCGRSFTDSPNIDGLVFIKSDKTLQAGDFVRVKITETSDYDLIGDVVKNEPAE